MNLKNDMISVVNSRTNSEAGRFLPTLSRAYARSITDRVVFSSEHTFTGGNALC